MGKVRAHVHLLDTPAMQKMVRTIEESTRANKAGVARFIEPAQGSPLSRATNRRHHIVFGRRGSGKSSLLRKAAAELTIDRRPIAYVDLEPFKGHTYPDVLLSVLITTFREFARWLSNAGRAPASRTSFWRRLFGSAPKRGPLDKVATAKLVAELEAQVKELEDLLHSADEAQFKRTQTEKEEASASDNASADAKIGAKAGVAEVSLGASTKAARSRKAATSTELTEEYKRRKIDFLLRHIINYQRIFADLGELSGGDAFLILDDLYHIQREDQPDLIDYFHRIAKNNQLWIKIGTIRHRTEWYRHGNPPTGMKLGDDADEIDLDLTLEKYALTKEFLFAVLGAFAKDAGVVVDEIMAEGARDRLVLASGGVARDFLTIFRRAIEIARERPPDHSRGSKIGAEDVNRASGDHDQTKRDELRRDITGESNEIEAALGQIVGFCTEKALSNCFLVEKDRHEQYIKLIAELVDMRLIHLVRSRTSVGHRKGKAYVAYMLDLSQYTGERKKQNIAMVEFWTSDGEDQMRAVKNIYDPERRSTAEGDDAPDDRPAALAAPKQNEPAAEANTGGEQLPLFGE